MPPNLTLNLGRSFSYLLSHSGLKVTYLLIQSMPEPYTPVASSQPLVQSLTASDPPLSLLPLLLKHPSLFNPSLNLFFWHHVRY